MSVVQYDFVGRRTPAASPQRRLGAASPARSRLRSASIARRAATLLLAAGAACGSARAANTGSDSARADSIARAKQDSINRAQPGYVIDSVLTPEEELRRFRVAIGGTPVTSFQHGAASRDELIQRLVRAVAKQDTATLRAISLTAREFADLVYPSSPYTHPPYHQPPALLWMQISNGSISGFTRLIRRRGGVPLAFLGSTCPSKPDREGDNRLWSGCTLRFTDAAHDTTTQRWFGTIIERQGQFKIVSYANQF